MPLHDNEYTSIEIVIGVRYESLTYEGRNSEVRP